MRRVLRLLVPPLAASLLAACPTDISSIKIPCAKGHDEQCPTGQICGEDLYCRQKPECKGRTKYCPDKGVCEDLDTALNCGDCGNAALTPSHICNAGEICQPDKNDPAKNTCVQFCQPNLAACNGVCVNPTNDRFNCGGCGNASQVPSHICPAGQACQDSQCVIDCTSGLTNCSGVCTDKNSDRANCGACGVRCPSGQVCTGGICTTSCPGLLAVCSDTCVDKQTDPNNCSSCGHTCDPGQKCKAGACVLECQASLTACTVGGVSTCVDLQTDRRNCTACGAACANGQVCAAGLCVPNCPDGETACGGACADLKTDRAHCGDCATACPDGQICDNKNCKLSCQAGLAVCNVGDNQVPTCVDTQTDARFCGGCTNSACPSGYVCSAGHCQLACPSTLTKCGASCVDISIDPSNCGGCGSSFACATGQVCDNKVCKTNCGSGLTFCDTDNTCHDLNSDGRNCKTCGHVCPSGTACTLGVCQPTCGGTTKLCGGGADAGAAGTCADIWSDPNNCGECGIHCGEGQICNQTHCTTSCQSNLTSCPSGSTDVCRDTSNDPDNCGGCGPSQPFRCPGPYSNKGRYCVGGKCVGICNPGFGDCNSLSADGCEATLSGDAWNCGLCGSACFGATPFCNGGYCDPAAHHGLLQHVSATALTSGAGFRRCYLDSYSSTSTPSLAQISTTCGSVGHGYDVLIGCRTTGSDTILLAALGRYEDVFAGTGPTGVTSTAYGVSFYFDGSSSWGFAPAGVPVTRAPCDAASSTADGFAQRMCWPTLGGALAPGRRCGAFDGLDTSSAYERVIFTTAP